MKLNDLNMNELRAETDTKPNLYTSFAAAALIITDLIVFLLNEIDVFHVDKLIMRACLLPALVVVGFPLFCGLYKPLSSKKWTKYVSIATLSACTFFEFVILNFHAYLLLLLPLFLATQYKDKRFTIIAIIGSIATITLAPIIGYLSGIWKSDGFLLYLAKIINKTDYQELVKDVNGAQDIMDLILYFELPATIITIVFSFITFNVTKKNIEGLESQLNYLKLSRSDRLTNLLNQNCYEKLASEAEEDFDVGVIFFDINDMKLANDTHGHEYGDLLINRCAASIHNILNENIYGFRLGGDEFLIIAKVNKKEDITKILDDWKNSLYMVNMTNKEQFGGMVCSLSFGYSFGSLKRLPELVREADRYMYLCKQRLKSGEEI